MNSTSKILEYDTNVNIIKEYEEIECGLQFMYIMYRGVTTSS